MIKTRAGIENELGEFCPELHPIVSYGPNGIKVRCMWALEYCVDPMFPVEDAKQEILENIYKHIGKFTVLARKLEDDLSKS